LHLPPRFCFRGVIRRPALSLVLAAALVPPVSGAPQSDLSANSTTEDYASGELVARGDARYAESGVLLTADEIRFNHKTQVTTASGHVVLNRPGDRLLADVLTYDRSTGDFTARNLRTGRFPYYIEGPLAEGNRTQVVIHDATVVFREPGAWQPTIKAKILTYSPGHYLRISVADVGIGKYRPLAVYHVAEDLARHSGVESIAVEGGYRHTLGPYIDMGLKIPEANGVSFGPDIGIYTFRGIMLGPIADYDIVSGDDTMKGFLKSGYIYDFGKRDTDILNNPVPNGRAFVEWQHSQQLTPELSITGDVNYSSDSEVVRDFHSKDFVPIQEPDNYLEADYSGADYLGSVFTRFQPDQFYPVQQRLPEIRFDLLPTALGGGIYVRMNSGIVHLEEDPPDGGSFLESNRFDTFLGLSRPFSYKGIVDFTPVVGGRFTEYWDTTGAAQPGGAGRALGEVGFDADLKLNATIDYQNPLWHIDGLRHLLTPTLSYRYIPDADRDAAWIPPIDRSTFTNYLPVMELGDMRALDQLQAENVLRVGVNNTLQTRDKTYGSLDLVSLDVDEDFNFRRVPGMTDFSDLHADLTISPARWLDLRLEDSVEPKSLTQQAVDTSVTFREGDIWSAKLGLGFLSDQYGSYVIPGLGSYPIVGTDVYHAEGRYRLNEVYEVVARGDFDERAHIFVDQLYGFTQKVSNTWIVQYAVVFSNGPTKGNGHFGINVNLNAVRF
jgi:LPS-assembly protein